MYVPFITKSDRLSEQNCHFWPPKPSRQHKNSICCIAAWIQPDISSCQLQFVVLNLEKMIEIVQENHLMFKTDFSLRQQGTTVKLQGKKLQNDKVALNSQKLLRIALSNKNIQNFFTPLCQRLPFRFKQRNGCHFHK